MTPNDLYNTPSQSDSTDLEQLVGWGESPFLPELGYIELPEEHNNQAIIIKTYANECSDGIRVWVLRSVWYKGYPIMITQQAGRDGKDYKKRFITNKQLYNEMLQYIQSLAPPKLDPDSEDLVEPDFAGYSVDQFYGGDLADVQVAQELRKKNSEVLDEGEGIQ